VKKDDAGAIFLQCLIQVDHMTEHWHPTDHDFWNGCGDRVHGQELAHWPLSLAPELFPGLEPVDSRLSSKTLSQIDNHLEEHVLTLTREAGEIPVDLERALDFGSEVFHLSERCVVNSSLIAVVWRHSIRTGYLAALISLNQRVSPRVAWQSFVGGVLHDIGLLIFLIQQPQNFTRVVDMAQNRGWDLPVVERKILGGTHAESGAIFLARWEVDEILLTIVACHDDPWNIPYSIFSPLTAVYAANFLEGGGMAQDGDGVIGKEGEAYLTRLGLWDDLPLWQGWTQTKVN
jgi:hypothetical protein